MKVGTDGVLLGAWANINNSPKALDIGTGTGLIALMMAQRNPNTEIVAIDIDEDACQQAYDNFKQSPWGDRLSVQHMSLKQFATSSKQQFDLIISNPPFFKNSLKPKNQSRSAARHNESLPYTELIDCSSQLSTKNGRLSLIIPHDMEQLVIERNMNYNYNLIRGTHVKGNYNKAVVRSLLEFGKNHDEAYLFDTLIIEEGKRHAYSQKYKNLTKDFYLAF